LPVGLLGFFLSDIIESSGFFVSTLTVAIMLGVIGLLMIFIDHLPKMTARPSGEKLSSRRALGIGLAQVISLIPGSSRSGTTIIGGRFMGLNAKAAAEYSFLVAIPIMAGLIVKLFIKNGDFLIANWQDIFVGNLMAFLTGIVAIYFVLEFLGKHSLKIFGAYRLFLSLSIIALLAIGVLK
jgi:undecaprenyl-diphosphatase